MPWLALGMPHSLSREWWICCLNTLKEARFSASMAERLEKVMKKYTPYLLFCLAAMVALLPAKVSAQTTMFFEGFENRAAFTNNWAVEGFYGEDDPILWGVVNKDFGGEATHAGTNKIYCAANRFLGTTRAPLYQDDMQTVFHRDVDLTGYKGATLTFWYKFRVFPGNEEEFDEFFSDYFSVYIDDEEVFSTLNFPEPTPVTAWTRVTINISGYAGKLSNVKFEFYSDSYSQADGGVAAGEGAYVDDVSLIAYHAYRPDYNLDGSKDLLLQSTDTRASVWYFNGTQYLSNRVLNAGATLGGWRLAGQADFDRDLNSDIFLHHPETGKTMAWIMDGAVKERQIAMRTMPVGWSVVAMADFDRNRAQDIVWQNSAGSVVVWYMNATNQAVFKQQVALPSVGSYFNIVGTSDFNFDGNQDLILQDKRTGSIRVRYLAGVRSIQLSDPYIVLPSTMTFSTAWRAVGTQDMNRDGQPDLIMHHTNGTIVTWLLDGLKVTSQVSMRKVPLAYSVRGHR